MITLSALGTSRGRSPAIRHAFFTRQGGISDGVYAALNCGFGSRDDPAKVEQNRAIAAAQLAPPGRAAGHLPPDPRHPGRHRRAAVAARGQPARRRDGDRRAGHRARRARGRLRAGIVRRPGRPGHRRRPWRLARRARRGHGGGGRGDGGAGRPARADPRRDRAVHRPAFLRGRPGFRRRLRRRIRTAGASSSRHRGPGISCSTSGAISPSASRGSASP